MKTNLFPDYVLDDALDDNSPDGDNGISDSNDDENCNYDNNKNNDSNNHNDNKHDDNDNNYDNDNDDQTIMIFQTMHFVELFICEKADFFGIYAYVCAQIHPNVSS